jgi:hypothetical protein
MKDDRRGLECRAGVQRPIPFNRSVTRLLDRVQQRRKTPRHVTDTFKVFPKKSDEDK